MSKKTFISKKSSNNRNGIAGTKKAIAKAARDFDNEAQLWNEISAALTGLPWRKQRAKTTKNTQQVMEWSTRSAKHVVVHTLIALVWHHKLAGARAGRHVFKKILCGKVYHVTELGTSYFVCETLGGDVAGPKMKTRKKMYSFIMRASTSKGSLSVSPCTESGTVMMKGGR